MANTTGTTDKRYGSNAAMGGPVETTVAAQQACGTTDVLPLTVQNRDAGPITYKADDGEGGTDFTLDRAVHCRPLRVSWSASSGTVNAVIFTVYGKDKWDQPAQQETIRLAATGTYDMHASLSRFGAITVHIEGAVGSTASVSAGFGLGLGTPVPFLDPNTVDADGLWNNKDIRAIRNPADDSLYPVGAVIVYPNPYNTVIPTADDPPLDVKIQMQTRFGDQNRAV